ncbi:tRNA-modifying protein YgfZ [Bowmanella dokdonensis]|uniref:tRNA-modifying protein YgfZ n=1 Tax=Bowmanella dokdonensis TaxID=751969 RepID=A0A939DRK5_9ALTE|nr:tRNA-modifying protein YgfZ [Bowmanella dokdonensis]MBN7827495.1 tRNA-modifying protein YgfZ [Bowmanella dokdonensis]
MENPATDTQQGVPQEFIAPLPHLGLISVSGEDRQKYLQSQLTNDLSQISPHRVQPACHCDAKGKVWNLYQTLAREDHILLLGHLGGMARSLAELKKYGVFSRIQIEDQTNQWIPIGGQGPTLAAWLETHLGALPDMHLGWAGGPGGLVIRLDQPQPRYLALLTPELAETLLKDLKALEATAAVWQVLDIRAGYAHIETPTSNEFIPQMLNMQALGAISFTKGCYMGQEVVARTKYLGRNKRASFILHGDEATELAAGDTLEIQLGENWRRGGTVLSCATLAGQTWLLAVLANDTQAGDILRSKDKPECRFRVLPLPYEIN